VTQATDPITGVTTYTPGTPTTDTWLAWSQVNDINGRVAREWTPAGAAFNDGPSANKITEIKPYDTGDALGYDRAYTYDRADRLTKVADHTAPVTGLTFDPTAPPQVGCTVRSYAYTGAAGDNGSRTAQTSTDYPGADCATTPGATSSRGHGYDSADRPTTGAAVNGGPAGAAYVYDQLGRQTTMPAVDAPDPAKGDITMAYFDSDLPQAITQGGITTTYALNIDGHRTDSFTGPPTDPTASSVTRHYTDSSDNPAWIVNCPTSFGADISTIRSTPSLAGGLGASITTWWVARADNGTATLPLANLHGDVVTNITLPGAQAETTPVTTIGAWSDYTEFGTPRDGAATAAVSGPAGYGWLGAKERSTTAESAGLTLMGDRLYNSVTGLFTSMDPEPGGNPTAYTYPTDPINMFDLDGHFGMDWAGKAWGWAGQHKLDIALTAAGFIPGIGAGVWAIRGARAAQLAYRAYRARKVYQTMRFAQNAFKLDRTYQRSVHFLGEIVKGGKVMRDPGGARGAVKFVAKGTYGRSSGSYHLVVHPRTRMIYHWHFES
jgi:RHS repeat-associated protein